MKALPVEEALVGLLPDLSVSQICSFNKACLTCIKGKVPIGVLSRCYLEQGDHRKRQDATSVYAAVEGLHARERSSRCSAGAEL